MTTTIPRLLVVAHPGHELRIHGWLCRHRPRTLVFTDGSGSKGEGRLASTAQVLAAAGVEAGAIFGRLSDQELYRLVLDGDYEAFDALAEEIAAEIVATGAVEVVADAAEGFNSGHDVCRLLVNTAVARAEARTGRPVRNLEFLLHGAPDAAAPGAEHVILDDTELERKFGAAHGYPEMAHEVAEALARFGAEPFRHEVLRPVSYRFDLAGCSDQPPFYELHGEKRVAAGIYSRVLRFREHLEPLARHLEQARA
ncbi:MAG: hypothetical protein SF066_09765 [Thermoanaerobaculia bacterium]|nr:hypothetical protein [Thermoanaerobaculia bacterium]